jgi:hypothetical protein
MKFAAELHPAISSNQMQFFSWNKEERVRITIFFLESKFSSRISKPGINSKRVSIGGYQLEVGINWMVSTPGGYYQPEFGYGAEGRGAGRGFLKKKQLKKIIIIIIKKNFVQPVAAGLVTVRSRLHHEVTVLPTAMVPTTTRNSKKKKKLTWKESEGVLLFF